MLEWILAFITILLFLITIFLFMQNSSLKEKLDDLSFSKKSLSVKYGKMSEQWIPFSQKFPYNPEQFRFLGSPIDGLAFLDDKIVFCEFKANKSGLSKKQKKIKEQVKSKKIEWLEFKIN